MKCIAPMYIILQLNLASSPFVSVDITPLRLLRKSTELIPSGSMSFFRYFLNRVKAFTFENALTLLFSVPDLPALAAYYVDFITVRLGIPRKTISPAFLEELANYRWPGNVRELISGLERSILAARHEPTLFPKHLPMSIRIQLARDSVTGPPHSAAMVPPNASPPTTFAEAREATVAEAEAAYLRDLMQRTSSNTAEACRISGLSRSRLYALLGKYGISTANRPR